MMRPPRGSCAFMILMASCVQRNIPVRLVSTTFFHCLVGQSSSGTAGAPIPALLNRTSSRPNVSRVLANRISDRLRVSDIGWNEERLPARLLRSLGLARRLLELVLSPAGEHDGIAFPDQSECGGSADPRARSGHNGYFLGLRHPCPPCSRGPIIVGAVGNKQLLSPLRRKQGWDWAAGSQPARASVFRHSLRVQTCAPAS